MLNLLIEMLSVKSTNSTKASLSATTLETPNLSEWDFRRD
jgi:hypothetical protein